MDRRTLLVTLAGGIVVAPLGAGAQQPGKVYRLGVLTPGVRPAPSVQVTSNVLPAILREMGYVYGIIGGVGPGEYYAKAVGATVIANTTPGIYADLLKKR